MVEVVEWQKKHPRQWSEHTMKYRKEKSLENGDFVQDVVPESF